MDNQLIVRKMYNLDISELSDEEVFRNAQYIAKNIQITKLKDEITKVILKLSGVGEPTFGADARYIALDNQKRLNLIYMLTYNIDLVEGWVKNIRKNKNRCTEDFDSMYSMLSYTKNLIETIVDYGEYRQECIKEELKQIEEQKAKRLIESN